MNLYFLYWLFTHKKSIQSLLTKNIDPVLPLLTFHVQEVEFSHFKQNNDNPGPELPLLTLYVQEVDFSNSQIKLWSFSSFIDFSGTRSQFQSLLTKLDSNLVLPLLTFHAQEVDFSHF